MRSFLQIMREAYLARKAGVSAAVALASTCGNDDDWQVIFDRLMLAASLEQSLKKYKPGRNRRRPS